MHLKRFQVDFRGKAQKILGVVPFPMDLDISPYCDPKVLPSLASQLKGLFTSYCDSQQWLQSHPSAR